MHTAEDIVFDMRRYGQYYAAAVETVATLSEHGKALYRAKAELLESMAYIYEQGGLMMGERTDARQLSK